MEPFETVARNSGYNCLKTVQMADDSFLRRASVRDGVHRLGPLYGRRIEGTIQRCNYDS